MLYQSLNCCSFALLFHQPTTKDTKPPSSTEGSCAIWVPTKPAPHHNHHHMLPTD
jgi:hypothetical protein